MSEEEGSRVCYELKILRRSDLTKEDWERLEAVDQWKQYLCAKAEEMKKKGEYVPALYEIIDKALEKEEKKRRCND